MEPGTTTEPETMEPGTTMMTETTTETTTGRKTISRPWFRRGLVESVRSVRARILASVVLLAAVGLVGAGFAAFVVESSRIDRRIDQALEQEIDEFTEFAQEGVDPATGRRFDSVDRLLKIAMTRNVPDENEALLAFLDGGPRIVQGPMGELLSDYEPFVRAVTALPDGGFGTLAVPGQGDVRFAVEPVRQGDRTGAFVVAYFTAPELAEFNDVVGVYAVVATVALLLIGAGGWVVAGRLLKPLRELRATAEEISDTDLTRRIAVEGKDDVSDLARTLNAMLDRLEDAFAAQREFLDDAGHELRTPLTILRGHMELVDERSTEDVTATRALVLDELDRMGRLVDDLTVLAKAGRPDFLQVEAMDVGVLTDDVLDKARGLGQRIWQLDARASGSVIADRHRLTQALVQLASNAVRHTSPGDVIAIGSSVTAGWVRLWVRDTGQGVADEDATRIFERFERGTSQRSEGSGLGLAIVRAIAEAHGGGVILDSRPGRGATFTLLVPLRSVPPGQDPADDSYEQTPTGDLPVADARPRQHEEV